MCGENVSAEGLTVPTVGSSPRVRGKLIAVNAERLGQGLIPACAGKTSFRVICIPGDGAHPRVCGENTYKARESYIAPGSSPRVRGKPPDEVCRGVSDGLIPACAGKTIYIQDVEHQVQAHPRVCGENSLRLLFLLSLGGSSPRVRGKLYALHTVGKKKRLIPACAGKTFYRVETS